MFKFGAVALAFVLILATSHYSAYRWGLNEARLEQAQEINKQLAKSAQHIIEEQAKLNHIEDIIRKSPSSKIVSPVLMRTLNRLPDCTGKANCPAP